MLIVVVVTVVPHADNGTARIMGEASFIKLLVAAATSLIWYKRVRSALPPVRIQSGSVVLVWRFRRWVLVWLLLPIFSCWVALANAASGVGLPNRVEPLSVAAFQKPWGLAPLVLTPQTPTHASDETQSRKRHVAKRRNRAGFSESPRQSPRLVPTTSMLSNQVAEGMRAPAAVLAVAAVVLSVPVGKTAMTMPLPRRAPDENQAHQ